ncbi:MAG TPA: hypothetical protein VM943_02385 [Pyrinomonadaceae bacterium]|nr:hypothetical protein [Pyrinomonadaceae bacterium]
MMQSLTDSDQIENARKDIAQLLDARGEWFCTVVAHGHRRGGAAIALRKGEWEVSAAHGSLLFLVWSEEGMRLWRVSGWEWTGEKLLLEAARRTGAERATIELVPRASASAALEALTAARLLAVQRLAALVCEKLEAGAKVERVALSAGARRGEPGRFARIVLVARGGANVAATGPIADIRPHEVDAFLSSALLWFTRLSEKSKNARPLSLRLIAGRGIVEFVGERVALLRQSFRNAITVCEIDEARENLIARRTPDLRELTSATKTGIRHPPRTPVSELSERIVALAPEAIDVVRAGHGETLRFHGLAFARVRRMMDSESLWFGADGASRRQLLDESNWPQLLKILEELSAHRRAGADDVHHAFYRSSPEAWLESLLRRDITRLDPGLILSPLHAQFRAAHDGSARAGGARPIDMLALRQDGRLVVIELKVSEDASLVLQGADYWRRIEAHRQAGHVARARLFGDALIADDAPLVYLAAPTLRFHRAFETLAGMIEPDIEIYRFDLNEDWRAGVRVARRARVN